MKAQKGIFLSLIFVSLVTIFTHTIVQAQSSSQLPHLLYPGDLVYKGAFRFPNTSGQASNWAYGGMGLTYYPGGDSNGPNDGYPGSLYGIGHDHHQLAGEISIPIPVISQAKDATKLNVAKSLQPFADITGGKRAAVGVDKVGGIAYLEATGNQATDKLYWTIYEYYNAAGVDYLSHGRSTLNLSNPQTEGVWHLGPQGAPHSMKTADYIFDIPRRWADLNLGGEYLASGRVRENGAFGSSQGPALFSFAPYKNNTLPNGTNLNVTPLLYYPAGQNYMPGYRACDAWNGGAWLTTEGEEKAAVIFVGRQSLGETYYGEGRPGDCSSSKGFHCTPYESQILFYDPEKLAQVAKENKNPWEVVPYARMRPQEFLWPSCSGLLGGAAFDRARKLLYIVQYGADPFEHQPIMHVFQIGNSPAGTDQSPPASPTGLKLGIVE